MNINELRAIQAPLKELYKHNPECAVIPTRAEGIIKGENIVCRISALAEDGYRRASDFDVGPGGYFVSGYVLRNQEKKLKKPALKTI